MSAMTNLTSSSAVRKVVEGPRKICACIGPSTRKAPESTSETPDSLNCRQCDKEKLGQLSMPGWTSRGCEVAGFPCMGIRSTFWSLEIRSGLKATRLTHETMPSQHIARVKEVSVEVLNTRLLLSSLAAFACLGGALPLVCEAPRQRSQSVCGS